MASAVLTCDDFCCSRCGICCRKQKVVLLTLYDIFRLSEKLGVRPNDFFRKYCTVSAKFNGEGTRRFYLKAEGGCPFLKESLCSVEEVKPVVCARNPFYYPEASLAALKVFGIIEDECVINERPYDTVTKGDNERLVDMDILVRATDAYIEKYGRFDERTAGPYHENVLAYMKDPALRRRTYDMLVDQAVGREAQCRNDPYYQGAMNMYLSGFYGVFKGIAGNSGGAYVFEPSGLGMIDHVATVIVPQKDYAEVKKRLGQQAGAEVRTIVSAYEGREYVIISIEPGNGKNVMFYYHIERGEKKTLRHAPGEVLIDFKSEKGGCFTFRGHDADGWLSPGIE